MVVLPETTHPLSSSLLADLAYRLWDHLSPNILLPAHTTLSIVTVMKYQPGLKVNDQLVAYVTRFLAVRLKKYVWSHHHALKAKV